VVLDHSVRTVVVERVMIAPLNGADVTRGIDGMLFYVGSSSCLRLHGTIASSEA